jgi:hypothetical protein
LAQAATAKPIKERCQIAKADIAIAAKENSTGFINGAPSSRGRRIKNNMARRPDS